MTPERWQQIKAVLQGALALSPERRASFLAMACNGDQPLRDEVESFLAADGEGTEEFLSASAMVQEDPPHESETWVGRRIGPYEVIEMIGEGGMGSVYRAARADEQYTKQVAIKVVKRGLDTPFALARFRAERQILANLEHPNIGRLLDGGATEAGLPYVVMELVEGQPIDQYCDSHNLSLDQRLSLFRTVCLAVQYAHQHIVIHRDLKPANILVMDDGTPKLLDFGIAKIVDHDSFPCTAEPTVAFMRMLTPEYASPEQVRGEAITAASDVYSLGVVLYLLLAGRHPYSLENRSPEMILRAVCDTEPPKLSMVAQWPEARQSFANLSAERINGIVPRREAFNKLRKQLRGDLDNIASMALRKDPRRRYVSVEQLAEDIRRYLEKLPIAARKDTAGYRASKFVVRHKAGSAATATVLIFLVAALFVTLREARIAQQQAQVAKHQAEIARDQRALAEKRFNDVRKLANSLMFEIHDSIRDLPGATKARELIVRRALEYLDNLSSETNEPALRLELAAAYDRIGDVQGYTGSANLNDFSAASRSYDKGLAIRESLAAANPGDPALRAELVNGYLRVAAALENTGDFVADLRLLRRAQSLVSSLPADENDRQQPIRMAGIYFYTARALEKTGDYPQSLQNYRQAAAALEPITADPQTPAFLRGYVAAHYVGMAKMLARLHRYDEALADAAKGRTMLRRLSDDAPTNATLREYVGESYDASADVLKSKGDLEGALRFFRQTKEVYKQIASADPANGMARVNIAWSNVSISEILIAQNRAPEAIQLIHEALVVFQESGSSNGYWYAVEMGQSYLDLGQAYAALAEHASSADDSARLWREARGWDRKAFTVRSAGPNRRGGDGRDQISEIRSQLARCDAALAQLSTHVRSQSN